MVLERISVQGKRLSRAATVAAAAIYPPNCRLAAPLPAGRLASRPEAAETGRAKVRAPPYSGRQLKLFN